SGLPMFLWPHAVLYIIWNKNWNPSSALHGVTPYQARYGKPPDDVLGNSKWQMD
ncbi:hypothetical protein ARMGADRAFT_920400, partial [Armillaria gallica]